MSFDFALAHPCPHLTLEEVVTLDSDRISLRPRQPIANSQVRLTAGDTVIPPTGVMTAASLTGSLSGPFRVLKGSERVLLQTRTQSLEVVLPTGARITTQAIVTLLTKAVQTAGVLLSVETQNGFLVVSDTFEQGTSSRVSVRGSAAAALGFGGQFQAKGKVTYPPWEFAEMPSLLTTSGLQVRTISSRYIRFTKPIRTNPIFRLTYTTVQARCRRCLSTGIENDFQVLSSGDFQRVRNEDKLNQGVLKILSTIRRSNPFHPEYGSDLLSRIGLKAIGPNVNTITEDVTQAVSLFQRIQEIQAKYQEVTARERLGSVLSITTTPAPQNPTVFEVVLSATTNANTPVVITSVYAAPGTAALAGSNGLSLGLDGFGLNPQTRTLPSFG